MMDTIGVDGLGQDNEGAGCRFLEIDLLGMGLVASLG